MVQIIYFVKFQQLKPPNLVHIVLDQVRGVEFHVPVGSALAKHFVMIIVLIIASLNRNSYGFLNLDFKYFTSSITKCFLCLVASLELLVFSMESSEM